MIELALGVDFHIHRVPSAPVESNQIASYSLPKRGQIGPEEWHSIGLHPWDTQRLDAYKLVERILPNMLENEHCVALGEVGLDKVRGAALNTQLELLEQQLQLAVALGLPIVVHCVRAWSELVGAVRNARFQGNKAVHGFRGSLPVLQLLLQNDWYISIGPDGRGNLPECIAAIPSNRLLLESDASGMDIATIYSMAAAQLNMPLPELQALVYSNATRFFTREL